MSTRSGNAANELNAANASNAASPGNATSAAAAHQTLVDLLRERADRQGSKVALRFLPSGEIDEPFESLTYAELDRSARQIAAQLQDLGAAGERVLLVFPTGLDFAKAFFGCLYAGAVAVPALPVAQGPNRRSLPRLRAIVSDSGAKAALTTGGLLATTTPLLAQAPELTRLDWLAIDAIPDGMEDGWKAPAVGGESIAFLQYTSGSTRTPRGVKVRHSNLLANEEMLRLGFRTGAETSVLGWLPLHHDMGLIGNLLHPLYLGSESTLMPPVAFLQRPIRWLRAISHFRANASGGPDFAYDLCTRTIKPEHMSGIDLASWKIAFTGAEPVRSATLRAFVGKFEPHGLRAEALTPCYGLAEATLMVTVSLGATVRWFEKDALQQGRAAPAEPGSARAQALVGCGPAAAGLDVVVARGGSSARAEPGEVGEVLVAGPSVAEGYWGAREISAGSFDARVDGAGDRPYLRTGDLGFLHEGQLYVTGRSKDLIIIRGQNHYPHDIEYTVEHAHERVQGAGSAAFSLDVEGSERLVLAVEIDRHTPPAEFDAIAAAIRRAVSEAHDLDVHAIALLRPLSIPKTTSGKVRRAECRSRYTDGSLAPLRVI